MFKSEHIWLHLFTEITLTALNQSISAAIRAANVRGRIQEECYPLQTSYDYFCDEFENMLGAAFGVAPAVEGLGETESDAKDLLRSTISATVNKVCLDRYLEEYRKRREQAETIAGKEISLL